MNEREAQKTWDEYHERIKNRRIAEAKIINSNLEKHNVTGEIELILDFRFFTKGEMGAKNIRDQLSENYRITIAKEDDYWFIDGTIRPYTVNLNTEQHLGWVEFMHDVALSHGCIFSTWSITDPKQNHVWSSKELDIE